MGSGILSGGSGLYARFEGDLVYWCSISCTAYADIQIFLIPQKRDGRYKIMLYARSAEVFQQTFLYEENPWLDQGFREALALSL